MSLPYGGLEKDNKNCWLGNKCGNVKNINWYGRNRYQYCKFHTWKRTHGEVLYTIFGILIFGMLIFILFFSFSVYQDNVIQPIKNNIDGFDCQMLAEYIADRLQKYEYAIHRYEWLCVHEQVKEFSR